MARKKRRKLTPHEKELNAFHKLVMNTFKLSGFTYINTNGFEFKLGGRKIELDSIYVYNNIIIVCEETVGAKVSDHVKGKITTFAAIDNNKGKFLDIIKEKYPEKSVFSKFHANTLVVKNLYVHKYKFDITSEDRKELYSNIYFMKFSNINYFHKISKAISFTTRFELFKFFEINYDSIQPQCDKDDKSREPERNIIYPPHRTGIDKLITVSMMMSPHDLIHMGYVLRKDNWDEKLGLYQRLFEQNKMNDIRKFVANTKQTFYNNIVVALPDEIKITDESNKILKYEDLDKYKNCKISFPNKMNSICIIDGQHRIYAYHERNDVHEKVISELRNDLDLLVTGIIFPSDMPESEKYRIQGEVFLSINKNAKKVPADVILHIESTADRFRPNSIARQVLQYLNNHTSVFSGMFELSMVEPARIKVASIIKFALSYLVSINNTTHENLYTLWDGDKNKMENRDDDELDKYIEFCSKEINAYFAGLKSSKNDAWMDEKSKILSVVSLNGFIFALYDLIENHKKVYESDEYKLAFDNLTLDFNRENFDYTASQYRKLSKLIQREIFSDELK
ncbi:MAG: DGQHR domain-containing protein [Acholeplasmataceae bacterium]|nr:DGQHR domain-containing protein [Acholeplasmataceae bacterium]